MPNDNAEGWYAASLRRFEAGDQPIILPEFNGPVGDELARRRDGMLIIVAFDDLRRRPGTPRRV